MKENKKNKIWSAIKNTILLLYNFRKSYIVITLVISLVQGLLPIIALKIMQQIINNVQLNIKSLEIMAELLMIYIVIKIVTSVCLEFYGYYSEKFGLSFEEYTDEILLGKATSIDLSDFEDDETYNIINRAQTQGGANLIAFFLALVEILKSIITIGAALYAISEYSIIIVMITVVIPVFQYIYSMKIGKKQFEIITGRTSVERKSWYISFLVMTGNAFKEIRLNGMKKYLIEQYAIIKKYMIRQDVELAKQMHKMNGMLLVSEDIVDGGVIAYLVYQGIKGVLLLGDITAYINYINTIKGSISTVFMQMSSVYKNALFINLFFDFINLEERELKDGITVSEITTIELINVSYKYPKSKEYALYNINLILKKGEIYGLVGENGSGKSTLIKVIMGFYKDYEGLILINGIDLKKINIESYMKKISCLFQDYIKYEATIRENIGYGNIEKINDDGLISDALMFAGVKKEMYQEGLDMMLGNWFGKRQISIGEWQKIAIGRFFIKGADIYILDEPDASLDVLTKNSMLIKYKECMKGSIGIFISHKISNISQVSNMAIVLDEGRVVEIGVCAELSKNGGKYQQLYDEEFKNNGRSEVHER